MSVEDPKYSSDFFAGQVEGSAQSARVIVPMVLSLTPVQSVVDVGCGVGAWAAEFLANGVQDVWGVDGDYVNRSDLRIPPERFMACDLTKPLQFDRVCDLAVCLEVAEHLPELRADSLVADLCSLARCVLFSAAVPGQGGTHHINEQYISYWVELFQARGFEGIDPIRPRVLGNNSVDWWYQQNTVMFVSPGHALRTRNIPRPHTIIHQRLYDQVLRATPTLGKMARAFPNAILRSIHWRLGNH